VKPGSERRAFNNIFVYVRAAAWRNAWHGFSPKGADLQFDANLHWRPEMAKNPTRDYFEAINKSAYSEENKPRYPAGFAAHSVANDPLRAKQTAHRGRQIRLGDRRGAGMRCYNSHHNEPASSSGSP
jgi:hypothetical protein